MPFFLEVNAAMPRTFGQNQVHASQIVGWTAGEHPLHEAPVVEPDERDEAIAGHIVDRVPHGATLQAGIGGIPNAVMARLRDHRDLGVHTELISDGLMDLVLAGAVTGSRKRQWRNKLVATFALGTSRLYEWLDHNAGVEMLPVDIVNDPRVIAQEPRMVSVNATTEVDLYGQCASETIAGRYYSGSGGQADFARGAMYSDGGQAFVVTKSTTRNGRSRIRSRLTEGSVVTTLKNTVDNVVTEHGIAELRGPLVLRARAGADRHRAPRPPRRARARGPPAGHPAPARPASRPVGVSAPAAPGAAERARPPPGARDARRGARRSPPAGPARRCCRPPGHAGRRSRRRR